MKYEGNPQERLIVAADFTPPRRDVWLEKAARDPNHIRARSSKQKWVENRVFEFADILQDTGVYLKVNSALRVCGYRLIPKIKQKGLKVFADLKLFDISKTLAADGVLLGETEPEMVTVSCVSGEGSIKALKDQLPNVQILAVSVLTSLSENEVQAIWSTPIRDAMLRMTHIAVRAGVDGVIASPSEIMFLREEFGSSITVNTPGVRPYWALVQNDDQNSDRIMTPEKAIRAGADRIVVGRPITEAPSPLDACIHTIDEIRSVCESAS